ncbi:MAG TPA: CocE/NonD family hydrolase, partial [Kofleriaceae bacterium]|nr:CocE/NonD family hydrolase [Kofleriaceae bacterium]
SHATASRFRAVATIGAAARRELEPLAGTWLRRGAGGRTVGAMQRRHTSLTSLASRVSLASLALLAVPSGAQGRAERREIGVRIPMRDGVSLAANLFRPDGSGHFPVIVEATPYGREEAGRYQRGRLLASRGYAYVVYDCRGRHDSGGEFRPFARDGADGRDVIEWAAAQPWSNGRVGMLGASYGGAAAWLTAVERPPHLRAMAVATPMPDPFRNVPYQNGALVLPIVEWLRLTAGRTNGNVDDLPRRTMYARLPLADIDLGTGGRLPIWREWVQHSTADDYWQAASYEARLGRVAVPVLHVTGWYDDDQPGALRAFAALGRLGRRDQKLVVGPWPHDVNTGKTSIGPYEFGPGSRIDLGALELRWFDRHLRGIHNGVDREPPVRVFVMGANRWREASAWPLPEAAPTSFYFHSGGRAATSSGDGSLSTARPGAGEAPDRYVYDPARPAPFLIPGDFHQLGAAEDYRAVEERRDVLVYTTPPLTAPVEIDGPVRVTLFAASSAPDTDFVAMLVDVFPDGSAIRLTDGIVRARFRESFERPTLIQPGRVYQYDIDCWATGIRLPRGHRIRVHVTSSAFPRFDRNPNTGARLGQDTAMRRARQTVFHDLAHASRVVLPLVANGAP